MRPFVLFLFLVFLPFLAWSQFTVSSSSNANNQVNTAFASGDSAGNYVGFSTLSLGHMVLVKSVPAMSLPDSVRFLHRIPFWVAGPVRLAAGVDSAGSKLIASAFAYSSTKEERTTVSFFSRNSGATQIDNLYIAVSNMNSGPQTIAVIFRDVELLAGGSWMRVDSIGATGVAAIQPAALQSPANGATNINLSVSFVWFPVAGATDYKVTIWIEGYTNPTYLYISSAQTQPFSLPPNKTVQWQVTGRVNGVEGPPSQIFTFRTGSTLTGTEGLNLFPNAFRLEQNFPNPFNPTTDISFSLAQAGYTELKVYDLLGREVKTLVNSELTAGLHQVNFEAVDLPSGAYIYRLTSGNQSQVRRMVLQK
jgi:hypothetical protein